MKKNVFLPFVLGVLLSSAALFSCGNNDDEPAPNRIPPIVEIPNDAAALSAAKQVYPALQTLSSSFAFLIESASDQTISFEGPENTAGPVVSRLDFAPNTQYVVKIFNRLYRSIGEGNRAIASIEASGSVSANTKALAVGQVKLNRALAYLYLVQLYGEVPLILDPNTDLVGAERASITDVYTQIVKDLTDAEAVLPAYDAQKYTPTKNAANALLARAYLAWASNPLSQSEVDAIKNSTTDPAYSVDNAKLAKAVEYADKVIASGNYRLLPIEDQTNRSYAYKNYALYGREYENNDEVIYSIFHLGDGIDEQGNHQAHCGFTFDFNVEEDTHIGPADIDLINRWDEADLRREISYATHLTDPETGNTYEYLPPVTLPRFGKSVDHSYPNSERIAPTKNEVDRIEIRYADVLLIKAEALFEQGKAAEALPLVNQIRTRAYGNASHNFTALTREALRTEIEHEFVYDQRRWLDLVRWKTLITTVKSVSEFEHFDDSYAEASKDAIGTTPAVVKIGKDGASVNAFFAKVYKHLHAKYDNIKGKYYRFPIPTGEEEEDLNILPQNPGY
ncbi:MAG: RagB/SusD family nutrient uptake outer membrane protein [Dysgonamonadaceae bacterium]|jgi:hypothetical protein|nr:RagB/SusD family nutrient uptake outer membrane protein [Dysgonamonadaceae bacterium]